MGDPIVNVPIYGRVVRVIRAELLGNRRDTKDAKEPLISYSVEVENFRVGEGEKNLVRFPIDEAQYNLLEKALKDSSAEVPRYVVGGEVELRVEASCIN